MLLKYKLNFILVLLLVSALFLSTICSAGRADQPVHQGSNGRVVHEDGKKKLEEIIHERVLRVNTRDYGRYDPAPAFVKPPFKLIPN